MWDGKEVLNAEEVSGWLRIPKSTLYKLCKEGKIPSTKIGKHWRFDRTLVKSWFEKKLNGPEPPGTQGPRE